MKFIMGLSKKTKIILFCVILFIVLLVVSNISAVAKAKKAKEGALSALVQQETVADTSLSEAELEQKALIVKFGNPPAGFRWKDDGKLIAVSDVTLTAEDTAYYFIRALSTLDFSTAEKYSSTSLVIANYNKFYGTDASQSYYTQFLRKMYKSVLLSMEVNQVKDSAVFASGKRIITFSVNVLDLTDKTFWLNDKDKIFTTLYSYMQTESDNTKAKQYLYDYVLNYYQSATAKKHTVQIDLVLDKVSLGGWLVSDDTDLNMTCSYENGVNVTEYILESFSDWTDKNNK